MPWSTPVVADARAAGAARVSLQTEVGNERALALYRDAGFEVVDELTMLNLTSRESDEDGERPA